MKQIASQDYASKVLTTVDKTWLAHWSITTHAKVTNIEKNRMKIIIHNYLKLLSEIESYDCDSVLKLVADLINFRIDQCSKILEGKLINKTDIVKVVRKKDIAFKINISKEMMKWHQKKPM